MADQCPKCATPKSGDACPKCGLVFSKFDPAVLEGGVPDALKLMWQNVESSWNDQAAHALFVEHALMSQSVAYAATCYRKHKGDPKADEQLERINQRLEQMLTEISTPGGGSGRSRQRLAVTVLLIFTSAIVALIVYLVQRIIR